MSTELKTVQQSTEGQLSIFENFEKIQAVAGMLAKANSAVPKFLRKNEGDCTAVAMQAYQWRLSPFFLAQDAYQVQDGAMIAYGAKAHNAVITQNAPLKKRPEYVFFGNWEKIQGNIIQKTSSKGSKYNAPGWKPEDEIGVGVEVIVHIIGEDEPRRLKVLLTGCHPRNSTNWANDPQQQITYSAIRKIARRHFPDVLGGAVFTDEFESATQERDITSESSVVSVDELMESTDQEEAVKAESLKSRIDNFLNAIDGAQNMNRLKTIGNQLKSAEEEIQAAVRDAYIKKADQFKPAKKPAAAEVVDTETGEVTLAGEESADESAPTLDEVTRLITTATSPPQLDEACDMIQLLEKKDQAAARKLAVEKRQEIEG